MKLACPILLYVFSVWHCHGQVTVYSEDFDGNGGAGSNWVTAPLNQLIGVQGITPNHWYISGQECGNAPPACGSVCAGVDNSLHVSTTFVGDLGAAYMNDALCLPGCFLCDFLGFCFDVTTDKRVQSQDINTTGHTTMTLNFNYIENGQGATDDCFVEYSTNGGGTWTTLQNTGKTVLCGAQGTWTANSVALPAACENVTNLRIAFRWVNNADGAGVDPSFAVDDITITRPAVLPVTLTNFRAELKGEEVALNWRTLSELNNDRFIVERSYNGKKFDPVGIVAGAGNSSVPLDYSFRDTDLNPGVRHYRLMQVDEDGTNSYSDVRTLLYDVNNVHDLLVFPNPAQELVNVSFDSYEDAMANVELYDHTMRKLQSRSVLVLRGRNKLDWSLDGVSTGVYMIRVQVGNGAGITQSLVINR